MIIINGLDQVISFNNTPHTATLTIERIYDVENKAVLTISYGMK